MTIPNIPKPKISPNFTVDDIHKIREWHSTLTKDMTLEERRAFYHEKAMRFLNGESADEDTGSETNDALKKDAS